MNERTAQRIAKMTFVDMRTTFLDESIQLIRTERTGCVFKRLHNEFEPYHQQPPNGRLTHTAFYQRINYEL